MYFKKDVNAYQTSTMKNSHFFSTDETFVVLLLPANESFTKGIAICEFFLPFSSKIWPTYQTTQMIRIGPFAFLKLWMLSLSKVFET